MKFIKKIFSFSLILIILISLLGRNHLLFGTFLIMSKWFLLMFSILLIRSEFIKTNFRIKNVLILCLSLLVLEAIYIKIRTIKFSSISNEIGNANLKILSYNVYFKNKNKQLSYNLIKNEKADVYCFQEVTPSWNVFLENKFGKHYKVLKPLNGTHGISIYSKYPLKLLKYLNNSNNLPYAQFVELKLKNQKILICNAHIASPAKAVENPDKFIEYYLENYKLREKQYKDIMAFIKSKDYDKVIFIGDLNTTELEPLYRDMKYEWTNSSKSMLSYSFPNSYKVPSIFNLDYVLTRGSIKSKNYKVLKGGSSDHMPIVSELMF